jgi:hypothetical protein
MQNRARYVPSVSKALEVILWFANRQPGIDIYHIVKGAFYADKQHVATYGRPIIGDDYRAAPFGPLPQVVYALLRKQPIELIALGSNGDLPFRIDEVHRVYADRSANDRKLSASDIAALEIGWMTVADKSFDELFEMTHDDPAYLNAISGAMDYRDFVPQSADNRAKKIEFLEETAPVAVL